MARNMTNIDIKQHIERAGFYQWQVAERMDVTEGTLCRWLRSELPEERKRDILQAVEAMTAERAGTSTATVTA